jgi:hypothetical protein
MRRRLARGAYGARGHAQIASPKSLADGAGDTFSAPVHLAVVAQLRNACPLLRPFFACVGQVPVQNGRASLRCLCPRLNEGRPEAAAT